MRYRLRTRLVSPVNVRRPIDHDHVIEAAKILRAHELAGVGAADMQLLRDHAAAFAQPRWWRERNTKTAPVHPLETDLPTWAALGASDALARRSPRVPTTDQRPYALAYAAAYVAVFGAYMQQSNKNEDY